MGALRVTKGEAAKLIETRELVKKSSLMPHDQSEPDRALTAAGPTEPPERGVVPVDIEPAGASAHGRGLADIERDIGALTKVQRKNIFKMGALLIEAKAKVAHGEWLPWLELHFERGNSTAGNYMSAARYLAKFPTVGNLRLSFGAIYWLAAHTGLPPGASFEFGDMDRWVVANTPKSAWQDHDPDEDYLYNPLGARCVECRPFPSNSKCRAGLPIRLLPWMRWRLLRPHRQD
jgi:hypothetical protein